MTRELPRDTEAELDVLEQVFDVLTPGRIHLVADRLRPEHFFDPMSRELYAAAIALSDAGKHVGAAEVAASLRDRGVGKVNGVGVGEALAQVADRPASMSLEDAARRIREKHALRECIRTAERLAAVARGDVGNVSEFLESAEQAMHSVGQELREGATSEDVFSQYDLVKEMALEMTSGVTRRFVTTGIADLDADMGGFESGMVTVFGAPTNWGKSNFATMVADEALRTGKNVLIVSHEDRPKLYAKRLIARHNEISAARLKFYQLTAAEQSKLMDYAQDLSVKPKAPFIVKAIGRPIENVVPRIRRICQTHPIDLIVFDYLQAAKSNQRHESRKAKTDHVLREMTDVIKDLDTSGLIVSQIRRLEAGEEPTMHDLKESGDIENSAESILLGFNDAGGNPRVRLAKSKDSAKLTDYSLGWNPLSASLWGGAKIDSEPKPGPRRVA